MWNVISLVQDLAGVYDIPWLKCYKKCASETSDDIKKWIHEHIRDLNKENVTQSLAEHNLETILNFTLKNCT